MSNDTQANRLFYTLGIDIGISSIGWSIIQLKPDSNNDLVPTRLVDCGVRAFLNQADYTVLLPNINRKKAKLERLRLRRRKGRLLKLQQVLESYGIQRPTEFKPFYYTENGSPYGLRLKALEKVLEDGELYQVLHHLIKFRGFKSNHKQEAKQKAKEETAKKLTKYYKQIDEIRKVLENYRTIGEMLILDPKYQERKRNTPQENLALFTREDIRKELETILDYQIKLGNPKVNENLKKQVLEIFDYQKPFTSKELIEKTIGFCTFYKNEYRVSKYSPYNQEKIIWTKLNNLKIMKLGEKERHLTSEQKEIIYQLAFKYKQVKYTQVRKALNLSDLEKFKGLTYPYKLALNQDKDKKDKNPEDSVFIEFKTYHLFKSVLKSKKEQEFLNLLLNDYDLWNDIVEILWLSFKDSEAINKLTERLQNIASREIIQKLVQIKDIDGTANLSLKAIKKILPKLKEGKFYSKAVEEAIPKEFRKGVPGTRQTFLPEIEDLKYITNRVVRKSLAQARKLINAIIRTYGSPTFVNIELARDATIMPKEKIKLLKEQHENQKLYTETIEKLKTKLKN